MHARCDDPFFVCFYIVYRVTVLLLAMNGLARRVPLSDTCYIMIGYIIQVYSLMPILGKEAQDQEGSR